MELIVLTVIAAMLGLLFYLVGRFGAAGAGANDHVPAIIGRGWRMLAACGRTPQIPGR
ncbi:hypothetical protein [Zhihengliuella halotolerans]|uniref:Uncharacterized protein n=1 Tax=Zhihengliuella halotolerans TaxID=370736 RepID=A0A4Q8AI24_9MICC|nr:hypothetical protein [Zhihengliuella halotolerans]RZU63369.1 hypothetical protein EV380_2986 [Zhihengliuella halotolerans]